MTLMNIQLRHIRCFMAVADAMSFARAAERLHVSQPALSQTIIQLEERLGFPLFERTTRSVALTASGKRLMTRAKALSLSLEAFEDEARSLQFSLKNELRVGYMIGTAVQFIPEIVREFERLRPDASLHLQEFDFRDPTAGLRDGKVDCGIIRPPVGLDGIELVDIARETCVVCLPTGHRLSRQEDRLARRHPGRAHRRRAGAGHLARLLARKQLPRRSPGQGRLRGGHRRVRSCRPSHPAAASASLPRAPPATMPGPASCSGRSPTCKNASIAIGHRGPAEQAGRGFHFGRQKRVCLCSRYRAQTPGRRGRSGRDQAVHGNAGQG